MAENSKIEWTHHTFNPWWGCVRVSRACVNCYAEALAKRHGHQVWGPRAERRLLSDATWANPLKWNEAARQSGVRARVFCASMADVFEDRRDLDPHRERLWGLIAATPHLDWLLLTKRPDKVAAQVPWRRRWPGNVWIGTTVEDQAAADVRLPALAALPAVVRFISAEPLTSPLDIRRWANRLDWVITGGESGVRAEPASPSWFRNLRDQCITADIPFHFKQWGEYAPQLAAPARGRLVDVADGTVMQRLGKRAAGRSLDGVLWDELPKPRRR